MSASQTGSSRCAKTENSKSTQSQLTTQSLRGSSELVEYLFRNSIIILIRQFHALGTIIGGKSQILIEADEESSDGGRETSGAGHSFLFVQS